MELNQYFFGMIMAIGMIHLATVAGEYIGAFRAKRSVAQKGAQGHAQERDDWYVFFHCADLLGKEIKDTSLARPRHEQPARALPRAQENNRPARTRARL